MASLLMWLGTLLLVSCTQKDHLVTNSFAVVNQNEVIGQWQIVSYDDSGIDKTQQLAQLVIQFNAGYDLYLFNQDTIVTGTWNIEPEDGLDVLEIQVYSAGVPYSLLEETWNVAGKTTSTLTLMNQLPSSKEVMALQRL